MSHALSHQKNVNSSLSTRIEAMGKERAKRWTASVRKMARIERTRGRGEWERRAREREIEEEEELQRAAAGSIVSANCNRRAARSRPPCRQLPATRKRGREEGTSSLARARQEGISDIYLGSRARDERYNTKDRKTRLVPGFLFRRLSRARI